MLTKVTTGPHTRTYQDRTQNVLVAICIVILVFATVMTATNLSTRGDTIDRHADKVVYAILVAFMAVLILVGLALTSSITFDSENKMITSTRGWRWKPKVREIRFSDVQRIRQSWLTGKDSVGSRSTYCVRLELKSADARPVIVLNELGDRVSVEAEVIELSRILGLPAKS